VGENGGGELMGEDFYVLGRVEVGSKIEVREIDGAKESVVGDDRVEEDVDGGERGDLSGGGAGRGKTVTTRSAANTTVYARRVAALGAGEEERSGGPFLLRHGVVIRGGRVSMVDGTESPGSFDELNEQCGVTWDSSPPMGRRELRWWGRGGRDATVSPSVGNGEGGIRAKGIQ
jgi:hypothetical protein